MTSKSAKTRFLSFAIFIYNKSNHSVNPMVWRCREFFFSKMFVIYIFFDQIFFRIYLLGHFSILRGIEICAQRTVQTPRGGF